MASFFFLVVQEDFTLGKKLGEGAFGTVYRATFSNKPTAKVEIVVR